MAKPTILGGAGSRVDTHDIVSGADTRIHPIGTPAYLPDGRVFRWCVSATSATASAGKTMSSPAIVGHHQNCATTTGTLVVGSNKIVTGSITIGATAIAENAYQDGFLMVVDGGGEGTYYKIREHSAGTSAGTDLEIILYDTIRVVSDASTEVTLHKNPYSDPVLSAITEIDTILGVPNVAVTTGATTPVGFWVQSYGLCPTFVDGTPAVGSTVVRSASVQGNLEIDAAAKIGHDLGVMATVGINGEVQVVNLTIRAL